MSAALDAARKRLGRLEVGRALVDGGSVGEKDQLEAALRAAGLEVADPLDLSPTKTEHAHSRRKRAAAALVKRGRRAKRALPFGSSSGAAG